MKNILFLSMGLGSGGAERQMVSLAIVLKNKGHDVSFVCYSKEIFYAQILEKENIPIYWKIADNAIKRIYIIRSFIRKGKYDAVISFLATANFLNNVSAIGGKKWKVITGERSAKQATFTSPKGKIFAFFHRYSDSIVCNSKNAKSMWLRHYPQYKDKLITIYNYIKIDKVSSGYQIRKNGKLHILISASYRQLKNPLVLLKALVIMDQESKNKLAVQWYGNKYFKDSVSSECDKLREKYSLHNVIQFYDETKNIIEKMNESDIVALFSSVEGLPNSICEGLALGKPLIMTKVSDYNVLVDSTNGFLCDSESPESIKSAIVSALNLSNKELIIMGQASKQKSENLFSSEKILKQWLSLIS